MTLKELQKMIKEEFDAFRNEAEDEVDVSVSDNDIDAEMGDEMGDEIAPEGEEDVLRAIYDLLDALGHIDKPILLKRGLYGQLEDMLGAAERIMAGGNTRIAICPRGVGGGPSYRHIFGSIWSPDLMVIPALNEVTNIPVIYDPSHATGYRNFVPAISKAALAAGAHGLIIECHPDPVNSISDPDQAINYSTLNTIF